MSYVMKQDQTPLIDLIDAFVAEFSMSPITFGRKALGDPHFVAQLRGGRRCWPETEAKVRDFILAAQAAPPADESRAAAA